MAFAIDALRTAYSPLELTVQAQARALIDQGELLNEEFFTREDVDSVELNSVTTLDYRPTADRREWNARGRRIPLQAPARRKVTIIPVEANMTVDEKEMQRLAERTGGDWDRITEIIGASIPGRVDTLVDSVYRRLEVDAFTAWALGQITQRNPENAAQTYVASFGFSSARYTTAATAWNDVSVNAYDLLLAWVAAAQDLIGDIEGVMLRQATMSAILADAPNLPNSVKMTRSQLADRISEDLDRPFQFFVNEQSVDIFNDGGPLFTRTKVWPAQRVAAVPAGQQVGRMAYAPVVRAMELAGQAHGPDGIDTRGVTVYYDTANTGRELLLEAQVNAIPIPDEQKLYVTNVGV